MLLAAVTALVVASPVGAGGSFVDVAVGGGRVWFVGGAEAVQALDAADGRIVATPTLVGAPYALSVALAGGAAWVASVENGFVWGTLSRIDVRTGKVRVLWRRANSAVQYVAAGGGGVYALISIGRRTEIARFAGDGRLARVWQVPGAGRIAADASGCWISTTDSLVRIDPAGRLRRVLQAPFGDIATGAGAVWLAGPRSVLRLDERTESVRTIPTGRLQLGGFQHDLAAGDGALFGLQHSYTSSTASMLVRFDVRSGRVTGSASVPGIADAVIVMRNAVWVATSTHYVLRFDPRTLRRSLLVSLP